MINVELAQARHNKNIKIWLHFWVGLQKSLNLHVVFNTYTKVTAYTHGMMVFVKLVIYII